MKFCLYFCLFFFPFLSVLQYLREQPRESLCTSDHFKVSSELEKDVCASVPEEI